MSTRLIVVDDSDPLIQYSGSGWFRYDGNMDGVGNFGPAYLHTLHGTNSSETFSFSFQGTSVGVWGTNFPVTTAAGVDPTWECFVDNVSIGATAYFQYPENNWSLCQKGQLSDGPHVVKVNVVSNGHTFWFDYIRYAPSASVSTQNSVVVVDHLDPAIVYGTGWGALGPDATFTNTSGSDMSFKFTGTGLSWLSFIPVDYSHSPATATYSIDGGTPVPFQLNGLSPTGTATLYNQIFFSVSGLSAGSHTLHVVHGGNGNQTPLSLSQFFLTNPSSASSSPSSPTVTTTTSPSASNSLSFLNSTSILTNTNAAHNGANPTTSASLAGGTLSSSAPGLGNHTTPVGAIAGGAVGGFVLLVLVLLFLFLRRRRQKSRHQISDSISPFVSTAFVREAPNNDGHAVFPASRTGTANQLYDPWISASHSHSASTSGGGRPVMRKYGNHPVVTQQVVHEDSGRRFPQGQVVEEVPPGYSAD